MSFESDYANALGFTLCAKVDMASLAREACGADDYAVGSLIATSLGTGTLTPVEVSGQEYMVYLNVELQKICSVSDGMLLLKGMDSSRNIVHVYVHPSVQTHNLLDTIRAKLRNRVAAVLRNKRFQVHTKHVPEKYTPPAPPDAPRRPVALRSERRR